LAFDRALNNPAAALFGQRQVGRARLDVARAGFRIDRNQLAVDLAAEFRRIGVQRLGDAHGAALQQCDTRCSGGKLRDGQFERHSR
jgi:hypothetical protein